MIYILILIVFAACIINIIIDLLEKLIIIFNKNKKVIKHKIIILLDEKILQLKTIIVISTVLIMLILYIDNLNILKSKILTTINIELWINFLALFLPIILTLFIDRIILENKNLEKISKDYLLDYSQPIEKIQKDYLEIMINEYMFYHYQIPKIKVVKDKNCFLLSSLYLKEIAESMQEINEIIKKEIDEYNRSIKYRFIRKYRNNIVIERLKLETDFFFILDQQIKYNHRIKEMSFFIVKKKYLKKIKSEQIKDFININYSHKNEKSVRKDKIIEEENSITAYTNKYNVYNQFEGFSEAIQKSSKLFMPNNKKNQEVYYLFITENNEESQKQLREYCLNYILDLGIIINNTKFKKYRD